MSEEIIDGKREVLRVTMPGKGHPALVSLIDRAAKLGRYPHQFPVVVGASPPEVSPAPAWMGERVK